MFDKKSRKALLFCFWHFTIVKCPQNYTTHVISLSRKTLKKNAQNADFLKLVFCAKMFLKTLDKRNQV